MTFGELLRMLFAAGYFQWFVSQDCNQDISICQRQRLIGEIRRRSDLAHRPRQSNEPMVNAWGISLV
jgi:hypothetical protein